MNRSFFPSFLNKRTVALIEVFLEGMKELKTIKIFEKFRGEWGISFGNDEGFFTVQVDGK